MNRTIHWTEVPDPPSDHETYRDYKAYRRETPRLLAEGHEGKFVLIKGEKIVGLFVTRGEAYRAGAERYPRQEFLVQQLLTWEPAPSLPPLC
jgi:hypothetical protein